MEDRLLGSDLAEPEETETYREGVEVNEPVVGDCEVGEHAEEAVVW